MSYVFKLIAPSSACESLDRLAQELSVEEGLNLMVGEPVDLYTDRATCEVHFWHETLDLASRETRGGTGDWITTPELVQPLIRALEQLMNSTDFPIMLEATWQPVALAKRETVSPAELLALVARNRLQMDTRYEVSHERRTG